MKIYKFISCFIALLAVLCLGLTACAEKPGGETATPTEPTPTVAQTPAPEPSAAPSSDVTEEPITTPEPEATKPADPLEALLRAGNWYDCYRLILQDWKVIKGLFDFGYLEFYFGDEYGFDSYYLYDVDQNGTPELFLCSSTMNLTAVLTYADRPVFLLYDAVYAINPETAEVIIRGHWHGAGGSGTHEWHAARISGDTTEHTLSMDRMPNGYSVYALDALGVDESNTQEAYETQYAVHVKPAILAERFKPCALSDLSGLAAEAVPGDAYYYTMHCSDGEVLIVELNGGEMSGRPECYQVEQIRVFRAGEQIQSVSVPELNYEGEYLYEGLFILRGDSIWREPIISDYNFDGSHDIVFLASSYFPKNIPYAYFLWDDAAQQLRFSFVLLNRAWAYEQEVTERVVEGPAGMYLRENTYRYDENGQLVLVRSEVLEQP